MSNIVRLKKIAELCEGILEEVKTMQRPEPMLFLISKELYDDLRSKPECIEGHTRKLVQYYEAHHEQKTTFV